RVGAEVGDKDAVIRQRRRHEYLPAGPDKTGNDADREAAEADFCLSFPEDAVAERDVLLDQRPNELDWFGVLRLIQDGDDLADVVLPRPERDEYVGAGVVLLNVQRGRLGLPD